MRVVTVIGTFFHWLVVAATAFVPSVSCAVPVELFCSSGSECLVWPPSSTSATGFSKSPSAVVAICVTCDNFSEQSEAIASFPGSPRARTNRTASGGKPRNEAILAFNWDFSSSSSSSTGSWPKTSISQEWSTGSLSDGQTWNTALAVRKQQCTNCIGSPRETDGAVRNLRIWQFQGKHALCSYLQQEPFLHGKTGLVPRIHGLGT